MQAKPCSRTALAAPRFLIAALFLAVLPVEPGAAGEARHAIAMHGEPAYGPGFTHFRYANPDAPKGGRLVQGVLGTFDGINPFIIKGLAAQGLRGPLVSGTNIITRLCGREPDGARLRRAVHALWADRRVGRDRRCAILRDLPARSARALFRRQAGDGRRRAVLVAAAARQGPAQSPLLLFESEAGRGDRRARDTLRSRRQRRSRNAADPRADAGAAEARAECR